IIKNEKIKFPVFTDKYRLQQVLINLIDNSFKFTEKGSIEVSCDLNDKEDKLIFFVKDTGIGITEEHQEKIFNRFLKLEEKNEKLYRGAGLGLSICKNIVELLGGEIWLESKINEGSTFYFSIPV
ncbi:MAG: histidine kinase, partial [Chlorobi bacterium]|nr:histidine kinase [Chlorobiota bacterium]